MELAAGIAIIDEMTHAMHAVMLGIIQHIHLG